MQKVYRNYVAIYIVYSNSLGKVCTITKHILRLLRKIVENMFFLDMGNEWRRNKFTWREFPNNSPPRTSLDLSGFSITKSFVTFLLPTD